MHVHFWQEVVRTGRDLNDVERAEFVSGRDGIGPRNHVTDEARSRYCKAVDAWLSERAKEGAGA